MIKCTIKRQCSRTYWHPVINTKYFHLGHNINLRDVREIWNVLKMCFNCIIKMCVKIWENCRKINIWNVYKTFDENLPNIQRQVHINSWKFEAYLWYNKNLFNRIWKFFHVFNYSLNEFTRFYLYLLKYQYHWNYPLKFEKCDPNIWGCLGGEMGCINYYTCTCVTFHTFKSNVQ